MREDDYTASKNRKFFFIFKFRQCLILPIVLLAQSTLQFGSECSQLVNGDFFDLGSLQNTTDYKIPVSNQPNGEIFVNFCKKSITQCPNEQQQSSFAVFKDQTTCLPLTSGSLLNGFEFKKLNKTLENEKEFKAGVQILFTGEKPYINPVKTTQSYNYTLSITLYCMANLTEQVKFTSGQFNSTDGQYQIFGESPKACPLYQASYIVDFFTQFKWVYVFLAFVIGTVECFYGFRLFKPTLFLVGFISGLVTVVLVLFSVWTGTTASEYRGYIILVFAIFAGISIGFLLQSMARIGLMVTGGVLGFFFSLTLNALLLYRIHSTPAELPLYNAIAIFSLCGAILGYEYHHKILILATACIGAQQAVRSVGVVIGGYPNEFDLAREISSGHIESVPWTFYLYLAITVVMAGAGIFYQMRCQKEHQDEQIGASYLKTLIDTKIRQLKNKNKHMNDDLDLDSPGSGEKEMKEVKVVQEVQNQEQEDEPVAPIKKKKTKKSKKKAAKQEDSDYEKMA